MPCTRSSERHRPAGPLQTRLLPLLLAGACAYAPAPQYPRQALPPTFSAATGPRTLPAPDLLSTEDLGFCRQRGTLQSRDEASGGETVEFELWRTPDERTGPRPLVLLVPILAGGADLMQNVALRLQARGFDVAFCERAGSALKPPQRGPELEELFRRTVLHQRLLLAWLRTLDPAPHGTFVLGMSLGGMVATAVAALEPDLEGIAICLSGGDLPTLVPDSQETRVQAWVRWRRETDGIGTDHLQWELRRELDLEPVRMAASVDTKKVLFVSAFYDAVIPRRNQDLLWEALGRPARLTVPLGHYTAALAIDPILSAAADHFTSRIPHPASPGR